MQKPRIILIVVESREPHLPIETRLMWNLVDKKKVLSQIIRLNSKINVLFTDKFGRFSNISGFVHEVILFPTRNTWQVIVSFNCVPFWSFRAVKLPLRSLPLWSSCGQTGCSCEWSVLFSPTRRLPSAPVC